MKNSFLKFCFICCLTGILILSFAGCNWNKPIVQPQANKQTNAPVQSNENTTVTEQTIAHSQQPSTAQPQIVPPISRYSERITKKSFGIKVSPNDSPVQPERFAGYHTGTDFEIFPEELNKDVQVFAICDGALALKKSASGYGGVAVQSCTIGGADVTVVYGHMRLSSVEAAVGDSIKKGDLLGLLGDAYSKETDGERKHLHLSIHKGVEINLLGYVQTEKELEGWMDFEKVIKSTSS